MPLACNLLVTSRGNWFMREVATLYAWALQDAGVAARVVVDDLPAPERGTVDIVVAPHEYVSVGPLHGDHVHDQLVGRAVLATEQPGSPWWHSQRYAIGAAGLVLDINPMAVDTHGREGVDALHAPIGYHPRLDRWGGEATDRPIDLTFLGGTTERRLTILAGLAPMLSHRESRLLLHDPEAPVTEPGPHFVTGTDRYDLLAASKILLNVHRDRSGYFEWVRVIDALANGALVLTEPAEGYRPLVPMAHVVVAEAGLLAAHATALLADDVLRAKIAGAAYDFVRSELRMSDLLADQVIPALEDLATRTPTTRAPVPSRRRERAGDPLTHPVDLPIDFESRALGAIKQVMLGQLQLERRLSEIQARVDHREGPEVVERFTPGWAVAQPTVSVVIPLFNYAKTVVEAIDSVLASRGIELEIIVVEDHSTDGSRAVIEQLLDERPDAPILALLRGTNGGLGAARNLGIERARSERCFLLDADNSIYPDALAKLSAALEDSGAAFAYSIIEVFGTERSLLSAGPWDVARLTRRPYIDAMSLLDRAAWRAVGGFRENATVLHGWEDYAFWLSLAAAGLEGTWVPQPLCRYRRHASSMISTTRLDGITPMLYLREEFRDLDWP